MADYSSIFKELTKEVQLRFDAVSEKHKLLFDGIIFEKYMDWDTPSQALVFEELVGQYGITVSAPTIGDNSKEAILGSEGLQTLSGKVLNHAMTKSMTIQEYRKVLALLDSKSISDTAKKQQLVKLMWGDVTTVTASVLAKLDMIFLRALSNEGVFELDNETNPEGGAKGKISFNQPTSNIASANTSWTEGNKDTVDCFEDIMGVINNAQDKVAFSKILLAPSVLSYILQSKKMRQMYWGTDKSARPLLLNDLNEFMQQNSMPIFEPIRREIRVQDGGNIKSMTPWNAKNIVFVPDGKLGVVKNAYADSELRPEADVAYSNYGRIRVSQWGVGETQGSNGVEFTKAQCYALPVITEFSGIYTLKTQN